MSLETEIRGLLTRPPVGNLEYKAILPPSQTIAQYIAAFANSGGGYIVLGVSGSRSAPVIHGVSADFNVTPITHKAIDLLSGKPVVQYGYVFFNGKQLFAIKVEGSIKPITIDGRSYRYLDQKVVETNPEVFTLKRDAYSRIVQLSLLTDGYKQSVTHPGVTLFGHYLGVLKIMDNLQEALFPAGADHVTTIQEGKILSKILFSSVVDNFEVYLGDLLYAISLGRPETLKSTQTVTIEEVLNCSDMEEFIKYIAKRKVSKFQKGSLKEFIKENPPISHLNVLTTGVQSEVDKILQIRHLYTHRNGIVDEKFLLYYPSAVAVGSEFLLTVDAFLDNMQYLVDLVHQLDQAASKKYLH